MKMSLPMIYKKALQDIPPVLKNGVRYIPQSFFDFSVINTKNKNLILEYMTCTGNLTSALPGAMIDLT